jgi:hypothetical protein
MKIKIAIYGGTDLSPALVAFVTSLTKNLIKYPEIILVSGGFDHYIKFPKRKSVDKVVMETAEKYIDADDFNNRFETWLPKDFDRKKVERFRKGTVREIRGSVQARRFNVVQNIDALVTINGEGNTRSVVELALAINKLVLPIAFTGGDSAKVWNVYSNDIEKMLKMPDSLGIELKKVPSTTADINKIGKKVADFIKEAVKKTCLVLMPFKKSNNNFYDNYFKKAITGSNYTDHRIDRNDPAGNIPELFLTSLDRATAVIVDITGYNPNVMYELGHVHSKNMTPLIILRTGSNEKKDLLDLPFYLKQEMIVKESDNIEGYNKLKIAIESFLKSHK